MVLADKKKQCHGFSPTRRGRSRQMLPERISFPKQGRCLTLGATRFKTSAQVALVLVSSLGLSTSRGQGLGRVEVGPLFIQGLSKLPPPPSKIKQKLNLRIPLYLPPA